MTLQQQQRDDPYTGFNDYDHAYDLENMYTDREFAQAVARSNGRRPATTTTRTGITPLRLGTGAQHMGTKRMIGTGTRTSLLSRAQNGVSTATTAGGIRGGIPFELARPMTAVHGAGYSSAGSRRSTFEEMPLKLKPDDIVQAEENAQLERIKKLEEKITLLLQESVFANEEGDIKKGLDKAKEAARQWRAAEAWVYGFGVIPKKMNEVVMGLAKTKEIRKGE